jgi:carbonic anhydrase
LEDRSRRVSRAAGSSLVYNTFSNYTDWEIFIDDTISLVYNLHEISQILIVEHEKCGAYKAKYGDMTSVQEYQYHIDNSKTSVDLLWNKFNDNHSVCLLKPSAFLNPHFLKVLLL